MAEIQHEQGLGAEERPVGQKDAGTNEADAATSDQDDSIADVGANHINHDGGEEKPASSACAPSPPTIHPRAAEIIRQIDYYFSEENLRQDAHLLGLIQAGDGLVSLNEILGWNKMRKFKPMSLVRETISQQSQTVEVVGTKRLRRIKPLEGPVYVVPRISEERKRATLPADRPWMTKSMLKHTGFEDGATNGPIRPEEYENDRQAYDPETSFPSRIEHAIMKFCAKRKMHQHARAVWEKFLVFGGMSTDKRQFTGGLEEKSMEDYTKKEIAELTSYYETSEMVMDGLYEDGPDGEITWVVDFEGVAKAFLSAQLMDEFDWYNEERVFMATNVLRSFYNYLLYHDVCPEYHNQICAALDICDLAYQELVKLKEVDRNLPGNFNVACSTLHGGTFTGMFATGGDWTKEEDRIGLSDEDAKTIFSTGVAAYGTEEQLLKLQNGTDIGIDFKIISKENMGLEVTDVLLAEGEAKALYSDPRFENTVVKPMGRLLCKRWDPPNGARRDLPAWFKKASKAQTFEFLIEESTLKYCYPGLKMEVQIKELDLGIKWIDVLETTYPSYYVWLPNDKIRDYKPGAPTEWMKRQNDKRQERYDEEERQSGGEIGGSDEKPADASTERVEAV